MERQLRGFRALAEKRHVAGVVLRPDVAVGGAIARQGESYGRPDRFAEIRIDLQHVLSADVHDGERLVFFAGKRELGVPSRGVVTAEKGVFGRRDLDGFDLPGRNFEIGAEGRECAGETGKEDEANRDMFDVGVHFRCFCCFVEGRAIERHDSLPGGGRVGEAQQRVGGRDDFGVEVIDPAHGHALLFGFRTKWNVRDGESAWRGVGGDAIAGRKTGDALAQAGGEELPPERIRPPRPVLVLFLLLPSDDDAVANRRRE